MGCFDDSTERDMVATLWSNVKDYVRKLLAEFNAEICQGKWVILEDVHTQYEYKRYPGIFRFPNLVLAESSNLRSNHALQNISINLRWDRETSTYYYVCFYQYRSSDNVKSNYKICVLGDFLETYLKRIARIWRTKSVV